MRLSEAISPSTPLAVPFAKGAVLNIEYRPPSVTLAQMESMLTEAEEAQAAQDAEKDAAKKDKTELEKARERVRAIRERLAGQILDMVESWDLTENDGETPVPITTEGLENVPLNVFAEIVKAVRKHQSAGDSGKD